MFEKHQDGAAELVTPSKRPRKSQLNSLKRRSVVSSPRNSFIVKPLQKDTPTAESRTQSKDTAVSTPSEKVKSPKKSLAAVATSAEVKASPILSPSPKSSSKSTPGVESAKAKKLSLKRKSLNVPLKSASTPASLSAKASSKLKSLAVATDSVNEAKVAKKSGAFAEQKNGQWLYEVLFP